MKNKIIFILIALFAMSATAVPLNLDSLLSEVQQDGKLQGEENKKRESKFLAHRERQKSLLSSARKELKNEEKISHSLTNTFSANEKKLTTQEDELNIAVGALGEMFGVVRQVAADLVGQFESSVVSAQIKNRKSFVLQMSEAKALPEVKDLERLWFELQREMTESGKISNFTSPVVLPDGRTEAREVVRVGSFNLISKGQYLKFQPTTGQLIELPRQPSSRYLSMLEDLQVSKGEITAFGLDPSRGAILALLVQTPSLWESVQQGGTIGYFILAILLLGLGIVVERLFVLRREGALLTSQLNSKTAYSDNPLGQIMIAFKQFKDKDLETLEVKMDEIILKITPKLTKGIGTIKILAAVAPLLGLLGTVTGMILTFQSITLFGTGDPKLMAGGISQALVTTALGLICAIPLLLLHKVVFDRSKGILQILEEQSAGLIAERDQQTEV